MGNVGADNSRQPFEEPRPDIYTFKGNNTDREVANTVRLNRIKSCTEFSTYNVNYRL